MAARSAFVTANGTSSVMGPLSPRGSQMTYAFVYGGTATGNAQVEVSMDETTWIDYTTAFTGTDVGGLMPAYPFVRFTVDTYGGAGRITMFINT